LATRFDHDALRTLIERCWHIDDVTGERIRFLFLISETAGHISPDSGAVSSFRQQTRDKFLTPLSKLGVDTDLTPGQVWRGFAAPDLAESGEVRRVAQQLGISSQLPCLAWMRYDEPENLYVESVDGLSVFDIYAKIRSVSDLFNDSNGPLFEQIRSVESRINSALKSVELSIGGLNDDIKQALMSERADDTYNELLSLFGEQDPRIERAQEIILTILALTDAEFLRPALTKIQQRLKRMENRQKRFDTFWDVDKSLPPHVAFSKQINESWALNIEEEGADVLGLSTIPRHIFEEAVGVLSPYADGASPKGTYPRFAADTVARLRSALGEYPGDLPLLSSTVTPLFMSFQLSTSSRRDAHPGGPADADSPQLREFSVRARDAFSEALSSLQRRQWLVSANEFQTALSIQKQTSLVGSIAFSINDPVPEGEEPKAWWDKNVIGPHEEIESLAKKIDWSWIRQTNLQRMRSKLSEPILGKGSSPPSEGKLLIEYTKLQRSSEELPAKKLAQSLVEVCRQDVLESNLSNSIRGPSLTSKVTEWLLGWFPTSAEQADEASTPYLLQFMGALSPEERKHLLTRVGGDAAGDTSLALTPEGAARELQSILKTLGAGRLKGISAFKQHAASLRQQAAALKEGQLNDVGWQIQVRGLGTTAAVELEDLLRRLTCAFAPAAGLKQEELSSFLKTASLGKLTEYLANFTERPHPQTPDAMRASYEKFIVARGGFLQSVREVIPARNIFPHSRSGEEDPQWRPGQAMVAKVHQLVKGMSQAVEKISTVYPITVRPRSMEITPAHGNLWHMQADPTGEERVVLEPAVSLLNDRDYFLFTDTNPVRMYPAIVEFSIQTARRNA
jgi:hypothetical protein